MSRLRALRNEFKQIANPKRVVLLLRFFKTGLGEYGEGDSFIGITVPQVRKLVKEYRDLEEVSIQELLSSKIHEERLFALIWMTQSYQKGGETQQKKIYQMYLKQIQYINNWDLVDTSSAAIVGAYLFEKERKILYRFAVSKNLWERRISIVATHYFIKQKDYQDTLNLAEILLKDKEDLIHKAVGWMLREVGNRDLKTEENFLKQHYQKMPRTMLRYAIEKFPEPKRKSYLQK